MFRIPKLASFLTRTLCHNQTVYICRNKELHRLSNASVLSRFYSKDWDRDKPCPPCTESECKPPRRAEVPDCKPSTHHPCAPPPCDKPPQYQECPRPNRMDGLPDPICPYEEKDPPRKRKRLILLLIGTAIFLASCAAVYILQNRKPPRPPKKKRSRRPQLIRRIPCDPKCIPKQVPYLLIGGGTASFSAFRAIKSADPTAKVLVIANEGDFPYMRPPLSKELWFNEDKTAYKNLLFKQWNGSERSLYYEPDDFYLDVEKLNNSINGGIAVCKGYSITHIDVCERLAFLDTGDPIKYGKCLIATGASPKNLDIFANNENPQIQEKVTLFRNIFDFQELYEISEEATAIAIIGGGFLGSELACSLARKGKKKQRIYQIFKEGGNMAKILPEYLSDWTTEKIKDEGVEILPFTEVTGVKYRNKSDKIQLFLSTGKTVMADQVVVSVGVEPNTDVAEKSGLEVDPTLGGFLVNTELVARRDLYAAGDCACFYDSKLGRRRVEHHDHAVVSGRLAGENMTGSCKSYVHQAMFWSDLGPDIGYEAIGIVDSSLPTVGVFAKPPPERDEYGNLIEATEEEEEATITKEVPESPIDEKVPSECKQYARKDPELSQLAQEIRKNANKTKFGEDFGKGVIFYLRDDIVVGIVLWNLFNRMNIARQVLKDERKYDDLNEVAKLFNIHED